MDKRYLKVFELYFRSKNEAGKQEKRLRDREWNKEEKH